MRKMARHPQALRIREATTMSTLLQIHSSLNGADGLSSTLAGRFVAGWRAGRPEGRVIERDLASDPVPHLTAERFDAHLTPPHRRTAEQQALAALGDRLVAELQEADTLVLAAPMYNFGVPSTLRAWFDYVARAGVTFHYTETGPEGLLRGKRAFVFSTRGGAYAGTDEDVQTRYVRQFLEFLGFEQVEFVYAERTSMGAEHRARSVAAAEAAIDALTARLRAA